MDESHPSKSELLCRFLHRAGADFHLLLDTNSARSDYDRLLPMSQTSHRPGGATNTNHPTGLTVLQASPTAEQVFSPMRQRVPFRNGTALLSISENNQREDRTHACWAYCRGYSADTAKLSTVTANCRAPLWAALTADHVPPLWATVTHG